VQGAAASMLSISPNTLLSWMKMPEFDKEYRAARRASVSQNQRALSTGNGCGRLDHHETDG
jgi:hypothetical protein